MSHHWMYWYRLLCVTLSPCVYLHVWVSRFLANTAVCRLECMLVSATQNSRIVLCALPTLYEEWRERQSLEPDKSAVQCVFFAYAINALFELQPIHSYLPLLSFPFAANSKAVSSLLELLDSVTIKEKTRRHLHSHRSHWCQRMDIFQQNQCDPTTVTIIDIHELASIVQSNSSDNILIIDSRSFLEYNTCHVLHAVSVCCSKIVKRRLQQDKVNYFMISYTSLFLSTTRYTWAYVTNKSNICVY